MFLSSKNVGHIPELRPLAGYRSATLHILCYHLLSAAADVCTDRGPCYSAAGGGDVLTTSAADLVAENAANDGADNCPGNISTAAFLHCLFTLNPAALFRWSHHRAYGSDICLEQLLILAPAVIVRSDRGGGIAVVLDAGVPAHCACRGYAVVKAHRGQRRIASWTQHHAATGETHVFANFPPVAQNYRRRCSIIKAIALEIADLLGRGEMPAPKAFFFVTWTC